MRIDAHHHFWTYTEAEFGWIGDEMASIRRDFGPEDLAGEAAAAGIDGVVTVQARTSVEETDWLLDLYGRHRLMRGVVGWLPLCADDLSAHLDRYAGHPGLVGVREILQAMPDAFLNDPAFNRGVGLLAARGLSYDLLLVERQLEAVLPFVDRHPELTMVLDHIAKPRLREGILQPWADQIRELAKRPHVSCKLSGMVTEADLRHWTPTQLRPYFDVVLEAFGPDRLLVGSDWPVCLAACGYAQWFGLLDAWISECSAEERAAIWGRNAVRIYNLKERR